MVVAVVVVVVVLEGVLVAEGEVVVVVAAVVRVCISAREAAFTHGCLTHVNQWTAALSS